MKNAIRFGADVLLLVAILFCTTCAAPLELTGRADEASAQQHRERGRALEDRAEQQASLYDPAASVESPVSFSLAMVPNINTPSPEISNIESANSVHYNPTADHIVRAKHEQAEAAEQYRMAAELEATTNAACEGMSDDEREANPLVGKVVDVHAFTHGARIVLVPELATRHFMAVLACHQAWQRERHFEGATDDPTALPNVRASLHDHVLTLSTSDADEVSVLVARSRLLSPH